MSDTGSRLAKLTRSFGGKAAALLIARDAGLRVPPLFALSALEVRDLVKGGVRAERVRARIRAGLIEIGEGLIAVRCSVQSGNGAQPPVDRCEGRCGVFGYLGVAEAIAALADERGLVPVFVQRTVEPVFAGVSFSRDPLTFQPDVIVETSPGCGRSPAGGRTAPTRAFVLPETLEIHELERQDDVPSAILEEAARLAVACERILGRPQDIEWVWDGQEVWLVKARPLAGFEEAEVFSDTWSSEVWPGLIKPLVFDVGDMAVNAAWGRILSTVTGPLDIEWSRMAGLAASRAYFNETLLGQVLSRAGLPVNTLEIVMRGQRPHLLQGSIPRLLASLGRLLGFVLGNLRWLSRLEHELPSLSDRIADETAAVRKHSREELGACFPRLMDLLEEAAYLSALTTFSMGLRSLSLRVALRVFSVAPTEVAVTTTSNGTAPLRHLGDIRAMVAELPQEEFAVVESGDVERIENVLARRDQGRAVLARMAALLERWGHVAMVNTDFSSPAWREEQGMLWRLAALTPVATRAEESAGMLTAGMIARRVVQRRLTRLREFMRARDDVNDVLARAYDAWRLATQKAGRLLSPEVLEEPALVYFLRYQEMLAALRGAPGEEISEQVQTRAADYATDAGLSPPHRLWDLRLPPRRRMLQAEHHPARSGDALRGVAASPGHVVGRARVVDRFSETANVRPGEVLVVGNADIGWTPLLTVVAGVVAAAGGMLSHAAVVAREFGIPAVLAVDDATLLIPDGSLVRVDGTEGTVHLL